MNKVTPKKYKHLIIETKGPALWIWINRPEQKNALTLEVASELLQALKQGIKNTKASVIVISGKGDVFSSGGDIKLMSQTQKVDQFFLKISAIINQAVCLMKSAEKPILSSIPGFVGGISLGLALGTDIRIASSQASFCAATIRIGLVANGSATYHLPRMVGLAKANEFFFLGEPITAKDGLKMGMVNRVVEPHQLEEETQKMAEKLSRQPQKALGRLKKIILQGMNSSLEDQLKKERSSIAWSSTLPDFQEGIRAFLEKRKPVFNQS